MNPYETTGGGTCPACGEQTFSHMVHVCREAPSIGRVFFPPIGCICPPGANKECERIDCPRKRVTP